MDKSNYKDSKRTPKSERIKKARERLKGKYKERARAIVPAIPAVSLKVQALNMSPCPANAVAPTSRDGLGLKWL